MGWIEPAAGRRLSHPDAVTRMAGARIVLLGEQHDQISDHRFQELVIAGLAAHVTDLAVGFEMFPREVQPVLDAWVRDGMSEAEFLRRTGWEQVWGFPAELYLPLFRLCRDLGLPMLALNVERPVVSLVGREGWEALPGKYRGWLSPAVPAGPDYRRYLFEVTGGVRPNRKAQDPQDPAFDRFVRAQQVWDRAFACALAAHCNAGEGRHAVGIVGRGHLEYRLGVPEQLASLGFRDTHVALPQKEASLPSTSVPIADFCFVCSDKMHTSVRTTDI